MNIEKIKKELADIGLETYRIKQIEKAVYKDYVKDFMDIKQLPKDLRTLLSQKYGILSFSIDNMFSNSAMDSIKAAIRLKDEKKIETLALKKNSDKWAVCISTQVGCPVRCAFCMSGRKGLKRNLSSEEISDQVLFWHQYLKEKKLGSVDSVVYMGIGEPFFNYNNTIESIETINIKMGIGKRNISVSTSGHIPSIRQFAKDMPQVNLAISLHSANESIRNKLVPLNLRYSLEHLSKATTDYINATKRKVFIEYVMLKDVNDRLRDAFKLLEWIKKTHRKKYFTVNLIPYNETNSKFSSSELQTIKLFQNFLISNEIETTVRKSLGSEIKGACGQLAI
jgi:23S rRNA (adenine(2503)-C(2))-methyltransferase